VEPRDQQQESKDCASKNKEQAVEKYDTNELQQRFEHFQNISLL
jgi:hypothetical protein